MKHYRPLLLIGIIEILTGGMTLVATLTAVILSASTKPPNVLCFVIATSFISTSLGIGILRLNRTAYKLLIYFSSVILLSKLLIFMNIIHLNGALETSISPVIKNLISILYHGSIIVYLKRNHIKDLFHQEIPALNLQKQFKEAL